MAVEKARRKDMTRHSGSFAVLAAALLLPLGAVAADAAKPAPTPATAAAATAAAAKAAKAERQCSMPTSPRLQKKGDDCEQATERTRWHSKGDLDSTGQFDTAEALRQLNPSVR
jgi:hypothetical protein